MNNELGFNELVGRASPNTSTAAQSLEPNQLPTPMILLFIYLFVFLWWKVNLLSLCLGTDSAINLGAGLFTLQLRRHGVKLDNNKVSLIGWRATQRNANGIFLFSLYFFC